MIDVSSIMRYSEKRELFFIQTLHSEFNDMQGMQARVKRE